MLRSLPPPIDSLHLGSFHKCDILVSTHARQWLTIEGDSVRVSKESDYMGSTKLFTVVLYGDAVSLRTRKEFFVQCEEGGLVTVNKARLASLWEHFYVEEHPESDGSVCLRSHWDTYLHYQEGSACLRGDLIKPNDKRAKFYLFDAAAMMDASLQGRGGKGGGTS